MTGEVWWEKYLSKRSPLKHTCWWRDKLIVLWILHRQAKIFLSIIYICWQFQSRYYTECIFFIAWRATSWQKLHKEHFQFKFFFFFFFFFFFQGCCWHSGWVMSNKLINVAKVWQKIQNWLVTYSLKCC